MVHMPFHLSTTVLAITTAFCLLSSAAAQVAAPAPSTTTSVATGNTTESVVRLVIDPWAAGMVYAPVSVPTGTSVQFVWNGAHGVYLLNSAQCPTMYAAGANMLYNISAATSMNNNYTATMTAPGVYYFSCPVTGHCPSGQLQTVTVFDPAPGNVTGLLSVT